MSIEPLIVRMVDVRAAMMCSGGTRKWLEKFGFDFSDFLKNGIDAEKLIATGDPMALQVVEAARGRRGQ